MQKKHGRTINNSLGATTPRHPGGSKNLESASRNGNILHEYEKSGAAEVRLEFVFAGGERLIILCRKCKNIRTQT